MSDSLRDFPDETFHDTDASVAERLGVNIGLVRKERRRRGIQHLVRNSIIDWGDEKFEDHDHVVALRHGTLPAVVMKERLRRGIRRTGRSKGFFVKWGNEKFEDDDDVVAHRYGTTKEIVERERLRRGIRHDVPRAIVQGTRKTFTAHVRGVEVECDSLEALDALLSRYGEPSAADEARVEAEREQRTQISERIKQGLDKARAEGKSLGRPRTTNAPDAAAVEALRAAGKSWKEVGDELGCTSMMAWRVAERVEAARVRGISEGRAKAEREAVAKRSQSAAVAAAAKREAGAVDGERPSWGPGKLATTAEVEKVQELRAEGKPIREISKEVGVSKSQVARLCTPVEKKYTCFSPRHKKANAEGKDCPACGCPPSSKVVKLSLAKERAEVAPPMVKPWVKAGGPAAKAKALKAKALKAKPKLPSVAPAVVEAPPDATNAPAEDDAELEEDEAPTIKYVGGQPLPDVTGLTRPERQLAWAEAAQAGNRDAAHLLLDSVDPLIWYSVRRQAYDDEDRDDMHGAVQMYLLQKAIPSFNPSKAGWVTHASWGIKSACSRWRADHSRTVRIPVHVLDQRSRMTKQLAVLTRELGRSPTDAELCEAADISQKQLDKVRQMKDGAISLDEAIGDDNETTRLEMLSSSEEPVDDALAVESDRERVRVVLQTLPEREKFIIEQRLAGRTLAEIGAALDLSRERVRQIEERAMSKIRFRYAKAAAKK